VATLKRKRFTTTWYEVWGRAYWKTYLTEPGATIAAGLERVAVRCPHRIISVSKMTTARLQPIAKTGRVITIPLGVDLAKIDKTEASDEHVDVLYSGRLLENKGVDLLIKALDQLRHPRIRA
jgi:glycosyltransferase involved in cell wall biosynthesis